MATQTGLGEPRGPWFISPQLEPDGRRLPGVPDAGVVDRDARRRRALLAALAVVALSVGSGGLAGGWVASQAPPGERGRAAQAAVPADLVAAAARVVPGVVSVTVAGDGRSASGSGFAIDDMQHVVTNDHIVARGGGGEPDAAVMVETSDGRQFPARLVGRDSSSDIAVLRVPPSVGLTALPLARPGATRVGEPVLAVGSPLGLAGTVTAGIVSALDRQVKLGDNRHSAVQTDASINPGNSGGPLVNARGEVVGVNTAIATIDGSGSIGIGFAIPIEQVQQTADTIIGKGG
ncbi:trypsin-like peptidase domain-containing protein [Micromonospora sp. WMMD1102]|uniref:S1C family serine protease n=1 Tax=Micromonospora sp. WMMD1102 TaxID=3016105 RepID=UPI0024154E49|nr:trypsin-like peptidase domain-containing protein [Micromonospora sp. WMMD1102]MDG4785500.1 trypsin-like peptidase domain-containing protein [Micromonospora sp. WMMD1102]